MTSSDLEWLSFASRAISAVAEQLLVKYANRCYIKAVYSDVTRAFIAAILLFEMTCLRI